MRSLLIAATAIVTFAATMTFETPDANAVVRRAVRRAVVVEPVVVAKPAVVVKPVAKCTTVIVNGARVRRCI